MNLSIVEIDEELMGTILEGARKIHPKETILLLRGKKTKSSIRVFELVVPPLATYGKGFASLPLHMLPMDFSIVGTMHSHPSGTLTPSSVDLNHFFGSILMIVGFPYTNERNAAIYNREGKRLKLQISTL